MQWDIQSHTLPNTLTDLMKLLLENRQITSKTEAEFFSPKHPLELSLADVQIDAEQMLKAVERIERAKKDKEYVVVFGDYDADGVTATAILWETLYEMGVKAMPFIPEREKHGYGISHKAIDDLLAEKKPDLIITVDNGIVAHDPLKRLKELGVDVIVTDHHLPEVVEGIPNGLAPHSRQALRDDKTDMESVSVSSTDDRRPTTDNYLYPPAYAIVHSTKLCGATTAWFLARELNKEKASTLLDLCAIGTIADQMILLNANRSFAYHGLKALQTTKRVGLLNLYTQAKVQAAEISSYTINFVIAPRINAMGRLSSAINALRALCTKDQQKSMELIHILDQTNSERQELTWSMVDAALKKADEWKDKKIIILSSAEYHEGVIGLIAGKLVETFAKPAIVISQGETIAKASSRSIPGVNIVELIRQVREHLLDVGGHPMAAGFSLNSDQIVTVQQKLEQIAADQIRDKMLVPRMNIECELPSNLITLDVARELKRMEPFGNGNPDPVFGLKHMQVLQAYSIGRERKHLKLVISRQTSDVSKKNKEELPNDLAPRSRQALRDDKTDVKSVSVSSTTLQPTTIDCIGFGLGHLEEQLQHADTIDLAGTISINEWNGRKNVQMVVKDIV